MISMIQIAASGVFDFWKGRKALIINDHTYNSG
jgi:hypothetical protein